MHETTHHLLEHHQIRQTEARNGVLEEFVQAGHALSQPDLEKAVGVAFDRVTIYRTLSLFLEKGLIHKVLDDSGAMKYALCPDTCSEQDHQHEHVHFKCMKCGNTSCLEDVHLPHFSLPEGYKALETNLLIQGVCKECG